MFSFFKSKKIKKTINDVIIGDVFTEKFDKNITPFCEPVILDVLDVDYDLGTIKVKSNFNSIQIQSFGSLISNYYLKDRL